MIGKPDARRFGADARPGGKDVSQGFGTDAFGQSLAPQAPGCFVRRVVVELASRLHWMAWAW